MYDGSIAHIRPSICTCEIETQTTHMGSEKQHIDRNIAVEAIHDILTFARWNRPVQS